MAYRPRRTSRTGRAKREIRAVLLQALVLVVFVVFMWNVFRPIATDYLVNAFQPGTGPSPAASR